MRKAEAISLLGETASDAAHAIGITPQAFGQWPDELPQRLIDRVQAALWRRSQSVLVVKCLEKVSDEVIYG